MGIVHPDGKTDLTFFVRGKTHRDHIVRITRQVLARISHAIRLINDLGQRIVKIQLPAVIDRTPGITPSGSPEINKNIAEILVCAAFGGTAGPERFVVELNPFDGQSAENHRADASVTDRQRLGHPVCRRTGIPQSLSDRLRFGGHNRFRP